MSRSRGFFHLSPLYNGRKGQSFGRKRQMAMPDVHVRDTEAEGERWMEWIERNRETRQVLLGFISGEQQSRAPPTKLGLCSIQACKRLVFTVSRICSALHAISSEMVDSRFALRTGNQRIAAIPNFRAYMTAIRAGAHSRVS
jgi:hypothetical protein